jgi:hypothetical protein
MYAYYVKKGLTAIKHMQDEKGVYFEITPAQFLEVADSSMITELGTEILHKSELTEQDTKN